MDTADEKAVDLAVVRLQRRHPTIPVTVIRAEVERAYESFAGSRVRSYLPILLEREAAEHLSRPVGVSRENPPLVVL